MQITAGPRLCAAIPAEHQPLFPRRGTNRGARCVPCVRSTSASAETATDNSTTCLLRNYVRHVLDSATDRTMLGLSAECPQPHGARQQDEAGLSDQREAGPSEHHERSEPTQLEEALRTIALLEQQNAELQQKADGLAHLLAASSREKEQHLPGAPPRHEEAAPSGSNGHAKGFGSNGRAKANGSNGRANGSNGRTNGSNGRANGSGSNGVVAPPAPRVTLEPPLQEEAPAVTSCVLQHPGAVCCTTTTVSQDEATKQVMVTMQTHLRCAEDAVVAGAFSTDDLHGLAAQALLTSAGDLCRSATERLEQTAMGRQGARCAAHEQLTAAMGRGRVAEVCRVLPSAFGHESYEVVVDDDVSGRRVRAMFKPRVPGDSDGWHRVPVEWVAYKLNLMLGLDYVPPVAYRTGGVELPGHGSYEEGALLYFAENAMQLRTVPPSAWGGVPRDVLLSDTRILDVLLHNSDRHHGHFLLGRHWADGSWQGNEWMGSMRPVLIDHAAGFRDGAYVSMQHENAFQTGPVRCVSASTYLRLRFLDASAITAAFAGFLSEREMRDMLHRRNHVLRYLDRLVESQGYSKTVVQPPTPPPPNGHHVTNGHHADGDAHPPLQLRSSQQPLPQQAAV